MPDRAIRRRVLSQNFLVDHRAIDALVDGSGVGDGDLVLDIGAGNGLISTVLAMPLPAEPFRVVANIPFGITTDILHRLLDGSALARADMIVQAEVARK